VLTENLNIYLTVSRGLSSRRAPGWLELAKDAFCLTGSAVFQCMECHCTKKVRQNTFNFFFQSVSGENTVNMNSPPLEDINNMSLHCCIKFENSVPAVVTTYGNRVIREKLITAQFVSFLTS
jgi:hypothetical protein